MFNSKYSRGLAVSLFMFSLSGCVTNKAKQEEVIDPVKVSKDVDNNYVNDVIDDLINNGTYPKYEVRKNGESEETELIDLIVQYQGEFINQDKEVLNRFDGRYEESPFSKYQENDWVRVGLPKEKVSQFCKTQGSRVIYLEPNYRHKIDWR